MTEFESRVVVALERIATVLETLTQLPSEPAPTGCLHPMEQRLDFGTTDGVEDWQCGICSYRTVPVVEERRAEEALV